MVLVVPRSQALPSVVQVALNRRPAASPCGDVAGHANSSRRRGVDGRGWNDRWSWWSSWPLAAAAVVSRLRTFFDPMKPYIDASCPPMRHQADQRQTGHLRIVGPPDASGRVSYPGCQRQDDRGGFHLAAVVGNGEHHRPRGAGQRRGQGDTAALGCRILVTTSSSPKTSPRAVTPEAFCLDKAA